MKRFTVISASGRKCCQYEIESDAKSHAGHIGGTVELCKHNPERLIVTKRGVKRVVGIRQAGQTEIFL